MSIGREVAFIGCRLIALGLAIAAAIGLTEKLLQISVIWPVAYERLPDGHLLLISSLVSDVVPKLILSVIIWRAANWISRKLAPSEPDDQPSQNLLPTMVAVTGLWIFVAALPSTAVSGVLIYLSGSDPTEVRLVSMAAVIVPIALGTIIMVFPKKIARALRFIQKG